MASHFIESLINSQQLDDGNAEPDTESDFDIDTEPLHIGIDEDSENPSTSGDEARPRSTEPTGNETEDSSTVFKPIEVENLLNTPV